MSKLTFVAKCLLLAFLWLLSTSVATMCPSNCTNQVDFCESLICPEEPKKLRLDTVRSKTTRSKMTVEFKWNSPDTNSLQYIKGYRLNVTVIHGVKPDVSRTSYCYDFPKKYNNITDWKKLMNEDFVFDCFEVPDHCVDLEIAVESLPLVKPEQGHPLITRKKLSDECWKPYMRVNPSPHSKSINVTYKQDSAAASYTVFLNMHSVIKKQITTKKSFVLFTDVDPGTYNVVIEANYQFDSGPVYNENNVVMKPYIPTQPPTETVSMTTTTVGMKESRNERWVYIPVAVFIAICLVIVAVIFYCKFFQGKRGGNAVNQLTSWREVFCNQRRDAMNNIIDDELEQESLVGSLDVRVFIVCAPGDHYLFEMVETFCRLLKVLGNINVMLNIPNSSDAAEASNFVETCLKSSDYVILIESPELVDCICDPEGYRRCSGRVDARKVNEFMMCIAMWKIHCTKYENIARTIFVNFGTPPNPGIYQDGVQTFQLITNNRLERRCFENLVMHVHREEDHRFVREMLLRWNHDNGDVEVIERYAKKIRKESIIDEVWQHDAQHAYFPDVPCEGMYNHVSENMSGNCDNGLEIYEGDFQNVDRTIPEHVYAEAVEIRQMEQNATVGDCKHYRTYRADPPYLRQSHSTAGPKSNEQQSASTPEEFIFNFIQAPGIEDQIIDEKSELGNSKGRGDGDFTMYSTGGSLSSGDQLLYKKPSLPQNTRLPAQNSRSMDNINFYPDSHVAEDDFTTPSDCCSMSTCDSLMEKAYKLNMK